MVTHVTGMHTQLKPTVEAEHVLPKHEHVIHVLCIDSHRMSEGLASGVHVAHVTRPSPRRHTCLVRAGIVFRTTLRLFDEMGNQTTARRGFKLLELSADRCGKMRYAILITQKLFSCPIRAQSVLDAQ